MKKIITILALVAIVNMQSGVAQQRVDIVTGFGRTMFDLDNHSQAGFVPVYLRGSLGEDDVFQVGGELMFNLYAPTFVLKHPFTNEEAFNEKFRGNYIGAFGRGFIPGTPAFGRLGLGLNFNTRKRTNYTPEYMDNEPYLDESHEKVQYKSSFGFNLGVGAAIGDEMRLTTTLLYSYRKNTLKDDEDVSFNASSIALVLGISLSN